jgi:hypothetical protein
MGVRPVGTAITRLVLDYLLMTENSTGHVAAA